jgi:hypothetical protein
MRVLQGRAQRNDPVHECCVVLCERGEDRRTQSIEDSRTKGQREVRDEQVETRHEGGKSGESTSGLVTCERS